MKVPLSRLLSMVKMIFNISSFFNNSVRVASFLVKITFQAIISCKNYITVNGAFTIWNQDVQVIKNKIAECLELKNDYVAAYIRTRDKPMNGEVHKFEFSQQYIFGNFESFAIRLNKILQMFEKMKVFKNLFENRLEDLLSEEDLIKDRLSFESSILILKQREYDCLDFRDKRFDTDLDDFDRKITNLTQTLRNKLEKSYSNIWDTHHGFQYLKRFETLAPLLEIHDMDLKHKKMLSTFKSEMETIAKVFKRYKNYPPIPRNYPDESGSIYWVRSLLSHLRQYIALLEKEKSLTKRKEYNKLIIQFNDLGTNLMKFECEVETALKNVRIRRLEKMIARPILKYSDGENPELMVNFDPYLAQLLQRNERICKLNLELPSVHQYVVTRKTWFFQFRDRVEQMLETYNATMDSLVPDLRKLYAPHLDKVKDNLEPGLQKISWTCQTWKEFVGKVFNDIEIYKNLIQRSNDIYESRVEKLLDKMLTTKLYSLPIEEPWTLEEFGERVKVMCKEGAKDLQKKNEMIEDAIEDLIVLALEFKPSMDEIAVEKEKSDTVVKVDLATNLTNLAKKLEKKKDPNSNQVLLHLDTNQITAIKKAADDLRKTYSKKICERLVQLMKQTIRSLTKHFQNAVSNAKETTDDLNVIFVLETFLSLPDIEVNPSVEEIQKMLNFVGQTILSVNKGVGQWKNVIVKDSQSKKTEFTPVLEPVPEKRKMYVAVKVEPDLIVEKHQSFFKTVTENKEVAKMVFGLSTCLHGFKLELSNFKSSWKKFSQLWTIDRKDFIAKMEEEAPSLREYEEVLQKYKEIKVILNQEIDLHRFGTLSISTVEFKRELNEEIEQWNNMIVQAIYQRFRKQMEEILVTQQDFTKKLSRKIENLEDIRIIMETQKTMREIEIGFEMDIEMVENAFALITKFGFQATKEDNDMVKNLNLTWQELRIKAMKTQEVLLNVQAHFQRELIKDLGLFQTKVEDFVVDYNKNGPMQDGLQPKEASDILLMFQNTFDTLWSEHAGYTVGEELFGLDHIEQPGLNVIKKELNLLQRLYKLYNDVIDSVNGYYKILWTDIDIEEINTQLMEFGNRCRKLPKALKEWPAFHSLKKTIDDFNEICPLLELMSNRAMKQRHWDRIQTLTGHKLEMEKAGITLKYVLEAPLLKNKEEIEDICISAMKEKDIEAKLKGVTQDWSMQELKFQTFKNRGELLLKGDKTAEIVALAEDSLMVLGSLLSNRYNAPFKASIQKWLTDLSNTNEILEKWLLVQNMWVYLEAVFVSGDIAKQLPKEAKRFSKIDRTWQKLMSRAHDIYGVVNVCVGDEHLKNTLPYMQEQLELCQKSLSGYLEKKRYIFPRFFFVSDPAMLEVLGQGSDSHTIQSHLLSIFDNTKSVKFHDQDYNKMLSIVSREGEIVQLERPVRAEGSVEVWLTNLLVMSHESVHGVIRNCYQYVNDSQFSMLEMIQKFQAQFCILGIQMIWTKEAENALSLCKQEKRIMSDTNGKFLDILNLLIAQTTRNLDKIERKKYEILITVHMHQRDVFEAMVKMNIRNPNDFEWLKQSRFYFRPDIDKMHISITDVTFDYQNEFLGCQDRLVITPLTDRCYITLSQALGMCMGGAPAGPAGTGKTETVKDMGKMLGKYVVVFNCGDQMDFKGLGRIYKGLAQSGTWGCFDEFNRIALPVLSVAAQQISIILTCKKEKQKYFLFSDGDMVSMNPEFGIFITMNPTYAGRQELPENMKIQFRNMAMMVPDRQMIIRVKLASCGFIENIILAKKFFTLYKLCEEQLSKQIHYDFGLRNILSVLRSLGTAKRVHENDPEMVIVMRTLRDMNLSKMVSQDEPIFLSLITDLFPNLKLEKTGYPELEKAIEERIEVEKLVNHPPWFMKIIQLYETQEVRHGIMVLGPSGVGKSECIGVLMRALTQTGRPHKEFRMNPKSINDGQMFGRLDVSTNDWNDGIFSALWRRTMKGKKGENFWIVLDGPVDPNWIENLNSVLDDSKILTLANGDRLNLPPTVKLVFEPENLDNASPATVSRCGMVYMSSDGLDWPPMLESWIKKKKMKGDEATHLAKLFFGSFSNIYKWATANLKFVMNVLQVHMLQTMFTLLEALLPCLQPIDERDSLKSAEAKIVPKPTADETGKEEPKPKADELVREDPKPDEGDSDSDDEEVTKKVQSTELDFEQIYIFALCWAIGGYLEDSERMKLEEHFRESTSLKLPKLASSESIFDYCVDPKTNKWHHWNTKAEQSIALEITPQNYGELLIPNVGSIRTEFLIQCVEGLSHNVLLLGVQGSAKSTLIYSFFKKKNPEEFVISNSNFSFSTTPQIFQKSVEAAVDKRMGSLYGPPAGKQMTMFIDDLNMPEENEWGDQCTNEFFRALIENNGFYSLEKPGEFFSLIDVKYMGAMIHPGGGRNDIPNRLKRHFVTFNCTMPTDSSIDHIFGTIAKGHFCTTKGFTEEVISFVEKLVPMTRNLWKLTKSKMLPTPAKFHYVFNMRDLKRIWQGMIGTIATVITTPEILICLWKHELCRVISDRFTTENDKKWFDTVLVDIVEHNLTPELADVAQETKYFVDFMRDAPEPTGDEGNDADLESPKVYEPMDTFVPVIQRLTTFQDQYNDIIRGAGMDLVFFPDAIINLIKISRIIRHPGGHMVLVGVGGSGKQSLTKLASFIASYKTFQITLTRSYNVTNFVEDLKLMYRTTGITGTGTTFLLTEQDIKEEAFLEYINTVLSGGLITSLYTKEEIKEIQGELQPVLKKEGVKKQLSPENLLSIFLDRVKNNLHIVLCFSPVGEKFRSRALKFPGLISGCTINWLQPWPSDALLSVAKHQFKSFEIQCKDEVKNSLVEAMATVQGYVSEAGASYLQHFKRAAHVTPKSFLNFINSYKGVYRSKESEIEDSSKRMEAGLDKLDEAAKAVEVLKKELSVKEKELDQANKKAEEVLLSVTERARESEKIKEQVRISKENAQVIVSEIEVDKAEAETKLAAAKPALDEAEEALNTIKPAHIATVKKLGKPPHLIMRVMDATLILFRSKLDLISMDPTVPCPKPSWGEALKVMSGADFLSRLVHFQKDSINDEVVELLEPYLIMDDYNMLTAIRMCGDIAGLLCWTKAMSFFFGVNKEVLPLKINLSIQESRLNIAMQELNSVQNTLEKKEMELKKVQLMYVHAVRDKQKLTNEAQICQAKTTAARTLVNGLSSEKIRWTQENKNLKQQLSKLVGDAFIACSFLTYSGPFNQDYREDLLEKWRKLIVDVNIPHTNDLDIIQMLIKDEELSEWSLQGLPSDFLSLQNAAIVTKASSYPLLIDPQGQGKNWLITKESINNLQITNLNHKYFKTHLEDALSLGKPLLIEDIGEELDPVLDNLLEKNFIRQGKNIKVMLGDQEKDIADGFHLMMTTKLPNPTYSPEVSARCAIIDFTVTMKGLEDQLLGRVIMLEKSDLETERVQLVEDVIQNKATIKILEDNLLEKLNSVQGSLVDDDELIHVLQETKATASDVRKKLETAAQTQKKISAAREEYRSIARRGSILYFLIVELSNVNVMYQTSLKQILVLFDSSIKKSKATQNLPKRIMNILDYLTKSVWKYINRSLYEKHKFLFTLLLALKIDMNIGNIKFSEFSLLLKGGALLDLNSVKAKPCKWMLDVVWLNLNELSKHPYFKNILNKISGAEKEWKKWLEREAPEEETIPGGYDENIDAFRKLLLIRSWCPDRILAQARKYIYDSLGADFLESAVLDLEAMIDEVDNKTPLTCLLSIGSDPTSQIEGIAKSKAQEYRSLALGQGQEEAARNMIDESKKNGYWMVLQNCHLCLDFCEELTQSLQDSKQTSPNFRLWVTTEVNKNFPIGLLQMSLKFTNEPPQGIRASLKRTYADISQDTLDYTNQPAWQTCLFAVAFLHTALQERKKFGALGWNIPYEFNRADFNASVQFVMNHLDDLDPKRGISWSTVQFMLGEVQYGGRVTDDFDKRLLNTFTSVWFNSELMSPDFNFHEGYTIPECTNLEEYQDFICGLPLHDTPEVFGLNSNADITYQINTAKGILDQVLDIQPKEGGGGGTAKEESRESVVGRSSKDMLNKMPGDYIPHKVNEAIEVLGGAMLPMNIFLKQEIDRMQKILSLVRKTLLDIGMAIEGTIIMSDDLKDVFNDMFDAKVPQKWVKISWKSSTLGFWFTELLERDSQFKSWCFDQRPTVFWMTGFFNPQGFFTAMRQEVTRTKKGWALDNVICQNLMTRFSKEDIVESPPEGVYIHGLFLEGASLDLRTGRLIESKPKVLFEPMPVIFIYAINTTAGRDTKQYECPIYRKPGRTNSNYIGSIDFDSDKSPKHWALRGVALLCDIK